MSASAKEMKEETKGIIGEALHAAEQIVEKKLDVERLKEKAAHAIEDGIVDAKRMVKRGRYAAEDLVEDTAHRIKHDPWRSVAITFGVGVGFGTLIGFILARKSRRG